LYSDTDSVYCMIPLKFKDVEGFSLKRTLGVKNEIAFKDANHFVCIGSKAYAYKNSKGDYK